MKEMETTAKMRGRTRKSVQTNSPIMYRGKTARANKKRKKSDLEVSLGEMFRSEKKSGDAKWHHTGNCNWADRKVIYKPYKRGFGGENKANCSCKVVERSG